MSGDEVISVSAGEASDGDLDCVPPLSKEKVDDLPAYEDRTGRLCPKVRDCGRVRAARGRSCGRTSRVSYAVSSSRKE